MKVLLIDPADFLGGAELFLLDTTAILAKKNELVLVTTGTDPAYLARVSERIRVYHVAIPRLRPLRPLLFVRTLFSLRKIIAREAPDIVHTNTVRAGLYGALLGRPWTHFAHDFTFPKQLAFLLKRAKKVFACSEVVRQDLINKTTATIDPLVIPSGIDLRHLIPLRNFPSVTRKQAPVVAIVGRIDSWKGQDIFLKAAQILLKKMPEVEMRIYGESSVHDDKTRSFEKKLRQFVADNALINVRFCGFQPIETILRDADLLVHASIRPEPFGRVIIESLAAGKPIIASDLGGPREILVGEILAKALIDPEDPCLLAEKICSILADPATRNSLVEAGYQRAKDFQISKVAEKLGAQWAMVMADNE